MHRTPRAQVNLLNLYQIYICDEELGVGLLVERFFVDDVTQGFADANHLVGN